MKNKSDDRARTEQKIQTFLTEMHGRRNEIVPWSNSAAARSMPLERRRRQESFFSKVIDELDEFKLLVRYDDGADLPADLDAYFQKLCASIPQAEDAGDAETTTLGKTGSGSQARDR